MHLDYFRSVFCVQKNVPFTEYCVSYPEVDFVLRRGLPLQKIAFRNQKRVSSARDCASYSEMGRLSPFTSATMSKRHSTFVEKIVQLAALDNVAWTLLLVWMGLYTEVHFMSFSSLLLLLWMMMMMMMMLCR